MSRPVQPRLPLDALLRRSGLDTALVYWRCGHEHAVLQWRTTALTLLAEHLGMSQRNVARWAVEGIPLRSAEDACDVLGLHPYEVWPDDYLTAALAA